MAAQSVSRKAARWLAVAGLAATVAGCAASGMEGPYGTDPVAVARGEALAQQQCASCHGLGLTDASQFPGAVAFRDMRFDYNAISYERSVTQAHQGRTGMPPAQLSLEDIGDIGAYVRSLRQARRR
ncbi:MAG: cytochrome c [Caulobacteraceae bacterium]|nr:cytochrome c [Caulobacteraceae bacterium]